MKRGLLLLFGLQGLLLFSPAVFAQTTVFINEIHYDNAGTDTGEAIEVAGPAGTDLTGWSVVLYNGSNGQSYDTDALSGVLADEGDGFGFFVLNYPTNGIQNGAPDGIALVDPSNTIIQFLSYEGTFTAADGPANGLTSTSIGASESSSTPVGSSLQLMGTGDTYEEFSWGSETSTFGATNSGQTFDGSGGPPPPPPTSTTVFVNEIHYDNSGTDSGEAIEIAGPAGTDLSGWSIVLYNGANGASYDTENLAGSIPDLAMGFGVVAVTYPVNGIQNGSPDGIALVDNNGDVVQFLSYEGSFNAVDGPASGQSSTDIGITESSGTAVGTSLQLTGDGTVYEEFTWTSAGETFGTCNSAQTFDGATCSAPPSTVAEIFEIQGAGFSSPFTGQTVTTESNVVTALAPLGFFMQTPTARTDGDATTSDGIFVFLNTAPSVAVGDLVDVTGEVIEFFDFTEFAEGSTVTVISSGNPVPPAVVLDGTNPSPDQPQAATAFEQYEGMLVQVNDGYVTSGNQGFGSDPVAEVYFTAGEPRLFVNQESNSLALPGFQSGMETRTYLS